MGKIEGKGERSGWTKDEERGKRDAPPGQRWIFGPTGKMAYTGSSANTMRR